MQKMYAKKNALKNSKNAYTKCKNANKKTSSLNTQKNANNFPYCISQYGQEAYTILYSLLSKTAWATLKL